MKERFKYTEVGKTMSLSKSRSKSLLKGILSTGVLLVLLFATADAAMALEGGRLFRPYQPEEFGGKRRDRDGLYASLEAIYWAVSAPKGAYIGATTPGGQNEIRDYYTGSAIRQQSNTMNASNFSEAFNMGTRVEVGNRHGHHGWHFSGFGLPGTGSTVSAENVDFVVRDEGNITMAPIDTYNGNGYYGGFVNVWDPNAPFGDQFKNKDLLNLDMDTQVSNIGRLWGWFPIHYHTPSGVIFFESKLAPVPISFGSMEVTNRTENWGLELSYTYKTHPFKWGGLELMAGARYWEFDDHFNILGSGPGTLERELVGDEGEGEGIEMLIPYPNVNAMGPVSLLATLDVEARGLNRVIGPQIGAKFKRQNGRWTLGSEIRFMAGINNQSMRTQGYLGKNLYFNADMGYLSIWPEGGGDEEEGEDGGATGYPGAHVDTSILDQMWQQGVYPWLPVGMTGAGNHFNHKLNKTYFSPVVEWRIDADWRWTDAVSFNVGFNTTFADNIARAYRITDYKVSNTEIFGVRGSRNTSVLVYGLTFGLKLQR